MRRALLPFFFFCTAFAQDLIFEHATVIDATGGPPKKDFSVTVASGRITEVKKTTRQRRKSGVTVINAKGKFLIPGLWDMHVHLSVPEVQFPLWVANGITGVRDMYSGVPLATIRQWSGLPDAPLVVTPGFLDGPLMTPGNPDSFAVATADQGRQAVRLLAAQGVDFLKIYNSVPRAAFFAIAEEARAAGLPFVGHVPEEVSPLEASDAGMRSEEHLNNILLNASTRETELRAERMAVMYDPRLTGEARLRLLAWPLLEGLLDTYSEDKAALLFRTFVKNGTWITPTLVIQAGFVRERDDDFVRDPRRRSLPETWTDNWDPQVVYFLKDLSAGEWDTLHARIRALLDRYKKLVGDMRRAGVEFLAGTDTNAINPVLPGWGLHEELGLLVESGLTPMEALQAATRNPARYFGRLPEMGTVEAGKAADLVLLDADPLKDIRNVQKIAAVVMRGHYYSRRDLDQMLNRAAAAASSVH